jgi:hypothetical protein
LALAERAINTAADDLLATCISSGQRSRPINCTAASQSLYKCYKAGVVLGVSLRRGYRGVTKYRALCVRDMYSKRAMYSTYPSTPYVCVLLPALRATAPTNYADPQGWKQDIWRQGQGQWQTPECAWLVLVACGVPARKSIKNRGWWAPFTSPIRALSVFAFRDALASPSIFPLGRIPSLPFFLPLRIDSHGFRIGILPGMLASKPIHRSRPLYIVRCAGSTRCCVSITYRKLNRAGWLSHPANRSWLEAPSFTCTTQHHHHHKSNRHRTATQLVR